MEIQALDSRSGTVQEKPTFIIIEEGASIQDHPYLQLYLAVYTRNDCANIQQFSRIRPLFTLEIYPQSAISYRNGLITWDESEKPRLITQNGEPGIHISGRLLDSVLAKPMSVFDWNLITLENSCSGPYSGWSHQSEERKKYARPRYFFELAMTAAK